MNRQFLSKHWYASAYEQFETQTNDVDFLLKVLRENTSGESLNILEAACGGGRICVSLARAGYNVTGFDADEYMLLRCQRKIADIPNITCYKADAVLDDWSAVRSGYDVVIMAGNILINIESETDYAEAQRIFIKKAAAVLRPGGYLYLDYDQHSEASALKFFNRLGESGRLGVDAEYTDEFGTCGKFKNYGSVYDPITRICVWASHRELVTCNGERIIESTIGHKHIPTLAQVYEWLTEAGLSTGRTYRNYTDEPLSEQDLNFARATIWAVKGYS